MWLGQRKLDVREAAHRVSVEEGINEFSGLRNLREEAKTVLRNHSDLGQAVDLSSRDEEFLIRLPFALNVGCANGGAPDLQLKMFNVSNGCYSSAISTDHGLAGFCQRAATLLFLQTLFPDQLNPVKQPLIGAGLAVEGSRWLVSALRHSSGTDNNHRTRQNRPVQTHRRSLLSTRSVRRLAGDTLNKTSDWAKPTACLAAIALLWKFGHPDSYKLGQAILVAVELSSGYNETKRKAASGKISSGPQLEAAWRKRHKWAAQKASKVMVDVYDSPPLRPFLTAAQKLSIGFVMLMNAPGGLPYHLASGVGFGRSVTEGSTVTLLASYPAGCKETDVVDAQVDKAGDPVQDAKISEPPPVDQHLPSYDGQSPEADRILFEPFETFKPSHEEDLSTGELPTITCFDDLLKYKQAIAQRARQEQQQRLQGAGQSNEGYAGPINIAANASGIQPAPVPQSSGKISDEIVLFTTEELKAMDPGMRQNIDYSEDDSSGPQLPLYGRADHSPQQPLTILDKQRMIVRALFLVMFFLPFLLLGPLMLSISSKFEKPKPAKRLKVESSKAGQAPQIGNSLEIMEVDGDEPAGEKEKDSWLRSAAWHLLLWGIRSSGAAFIKWGQWSSTREDMFPAEFCNILAELHDAAPTHTWLESKKEIERSFGKSVEELFETIDEKPLASGSVAQVHKAIMIIGGKRRSVVVKVRHPGVETQIRQDFEILKPIASAASKIKALKGLSLKESLAQFSSTMTAQTDLRVEAAHLIRFFRNFAPVRSSVTPPFPLPEYISEGALIETFEPGQSVAKYIKNPAPFNTQVVALGVDTYLKMLLEDNFVHTDLHPGNILVRRGDGGELSRNVSADDVRGKLQLILLDFGLAEELNPTVRKHFISFLHMIAAGDGRHAASHILRWSKVQTCPDPEGFTRAMQDMFSKEAQIQTAEGIELDKVMKSVLRIARQFEVNIDSSYAALVIGVVVLVGFATSMDPGVNLMDAAAPAFLQNNLLGKVSGRLYS